MNTVRVPTVINLMPMSVMQMKNDARYFKTRDKKKAHLLISSNKHHLFYLLTIKKLKYSCKGKVCPSG